MPWAADSGHHRRSDHFGLHTALKIAPVYSGTVVHSPNASRNSQILAQLLGPNSARYTEEVRADQQRLREEYALRETQRTLVPLAEARRIAATAYPLHVPVAPLHTGRMVFPDYDVADVEPFIDWNFFFPAWGSKAVIPNCSKTPKRAPKRAKSSPMRRPC